MLVVTQVRDGLLLSDPLLRDRETGSHEVFYDFENVPLPAPGGES